MWLHREGNANLVDAGTVTKEAARTHQSVADTRVHFGVLMLEFRAKSSVKKIYYFCKILIRF